ARADIEQRGGQRGGDAGRDQQAGKHAEGGRAEDLSAARIAGQAVERFADEAGQAQLEEAEHGHGEQREERREWHQYLESSRFS
ncbi:hypothetical protein ACV35Y_20220, partial [Acinetobacter baumannii]